MPPDVCYILIEYIDEAVRLNKCHNVSISWKTPTPSTDNLYIASGKCLLQDAAKTIVVLQSLRASMAYYHFEELREILYEMLGVTSRNRLRKT